jgi:adenosylmethionine---8-amino-7-oxononanoate aminotransferase
MTPEQKSPIWHPFTQHALQDKMTRVVRGEGAYLYTADDLVSLMQLLPGGS